MINLFKYYCFPTINTKDLRDIKYSKSGVTGVSPREINKVAPQVKKIQEEFTRTWIREYSPRKLFCEVLRLNPVSILQLSVYEKSAYNENICSVKCLGKSAAKIIQNIHERVHIS